MKCLPVSQRTDIFNFGATMYWALCGRKLPTLFTISKDNNSFLSDELMQPPHECNKMIPEALSNFVMECVRTNPAKRPEDMTVVLRRLELLHHAVKKAVLARTPVPA